MAEPVTTGSDRERAVLSRPWRAGGSLGRTLFAQVGEEPERGPDIFFGTLDTPTLAAAACAGQNALLAASPSGTPLPGAGCPATTTASTRGLLGGRVGVQCKYRNPDHEGDHAGRADGAIGGGDVFWPREPAAAEAEGEG